MPHQLQFRLHPGEWAVCRLDATAPIPAWAEGEGFLSITRTREELSIVCLQDRVPSGVRHQPGWTCLELAGPFAFNLTGILASILIPLAEAEVPIFAQSTFDTDWVLIPAEELPTALTALTKAGHGQLP
jgi:hypothetical protein